MAMTLVEAGGAALTGRSLTELEAVIERGLASFIEVGLALLEIRDRNLYQAQGFRRFEDYCRDRFSLKRQRAYALMDAARVTTAVSEISDTAPKKESHAAALAPLKEEPEVMAAVWREVVETAPNGNVTAAHVEEVVERYAEPEPEGAPDADADAEPEDVSAFWAARDALLALRSAAQQQANRFGLECYPEDLSIDQINEVSKRANAAVAALTALASVLDQVAGEKAKPGWKPPVRRSLAKRRTGPSPQEQDIIAALEAWGPSTSKELEPRVNIPLYRLSARLTEMESRGYIVRGERRDRAYVYALAPEAGT